jgi:hypothetical protein
MNGTYFARPILSADNELQRKNVAIDPQASDRSGGSPDREDP